MTNTRSANRAGRRMVLIDIENMAGTPTPTSLEVELVMAALAELVPGFNEAHRVVACSHRAARTVAFACQKERQRWRSGLDGADLALLEVLETEHVDERFEYVNNLLGRCDLRGGGGPACEARCRHDRGGTERPPGGTA